MTASQLDHRATTHRLSQTMFLGITRTKANMDKPNGTTLTFDQRIGGQCRGQRRKTDLRGLHSGLGQYLTDSRTNAQSQILARGQRFALCQHRAAIADQHRIGKGAARIHPQRQNHVCPHFAFRR